MAHKLTVWKQNDFAENCKTVWVLPDSLKTFRMVSKLSGSFQKVSKLSRQFQNWSNISRWSKKFPEDSKAGGIFPNDLKLSSQVWKLLGWFQIFSKVSEKFRKCVKIVENTWGTRPSILCVTHQMSSKKRNYSVGWTVHYEMMNYKWYLMVLGQYMTILKVSRSQGLKVSRSQGLKVS